MCAGAWKSRSCKVLSKKFTVYILPSHEFLYRGLVIKEIHMQTRSSNTKMKMQSGEVSLCPTPDEWLSCMFLFWGSFWMGFLGGTLKASTKKKNHLGMDSDCFSIGFMLWWILYKEIDK